MSQNFPHAMAHSRGARPKVRGGFRQNEAEQQENLCGQAFDVMQQDVENNLKFYENLINENFGPIDRGAVGGGGNPNVPQMGGNVPPCRGYRAAPLVNRAEDNEDCLRPPFSKPNLRGPCLPMSNVPFQCPDACTGRNQTRCHVEPAGTEPPAHAQGMPFMHPVNQMAWQPRTNNFPEMPNAFPRSEDLQRHLAPQPQPIRGPNRFQDHPAHPPAAAAPPGHSHHDHHDLGADHDHHAHHAHHGPNLNLDPRPQAPRGLQQPPDDHMEDHHHQHHHHHHHHEESPRQPGERDEKAVSALRHLVQFRRSPSYVKCDKRGSLEFLDVCSQKQEGAARSPPKEFPRIPCLQDHALKDLINCEKQDVESTLYLVSDEKKTYKKPCPKQQKAQMTVQALIHGHGGPTCPKEYAPLEHPDPDDISPEVAAAMVFCQEQGIDLAGCPKLAINFLFPEEPKPPFPEKIQPENISVVGPDQGQQEDMIEQSATVSAEGVSDSAYTRTMKEKGEDLGPQKSYDVDFAVGQTKREYVLVAQKPQRVNRVQFRGGASPTWFPGYFAAFPDEDGSLKLVSSPSRLLHRAWVHSKPVNMPQSDIIVVD